MSLRFLEFEIIEPDQLRNTAPSATSARVADGGGLAKLRYRRFKTIAGYGIMSTPGLALNEKDVSAGCVLSGPEIAQLLAQAEAPGS